MRGPWIFARRFASPTSDKRANLRATKTAGAESLESSSLCSQRELWRRVFSLEFTGQVLISWHVVMTVTQRLDGGDGRKRTIAMRSGSILTGTCIAIIAMTMCAGNSYAGFSDSREAKTVPATVTQNAVASADEDAAPELKFDSKVEEHATEQVQSTEQPPRAELEQPVAAPLPVALLPGGMLLAGSFFATKILKKRIV